LKLKAQWIPRADCVVILIGSLASSNIRKLRRENPRFTAGN